MTFVNESKEKELEVLSVELANCTDEIKQAEIEVKMQEVSEYLSSLEIKTEKANSLIKKANSDNEIKGLFQNWTIKSDSENFLKIQKLLLENGLIEQNQTLNIVKQVKISLFYNNPRFSNIKNMVDSMLNEIDLNKNFVEVSNNVELYRQDEIKLHNELYSLKKNIDKETKTLAQAELIQMELEVSEQALKTAKAKSRKELLDYKKSVKANLKHKLGLNCI